MGVFIRPKENLIGNILVDEVKDNNKIMKSVEVNTYSMPQKKLFKLFFEQKNLYKTVTSYLNELYTNKKKYNK